MIPRPRSSSDAPALRAGLLAGVILLLSSSVAAAAQSAAHAQLSWSATSTVGDLPTPGATASLFIRLTEGVTSFKGAEFDVTWDPAGDATCLAHASTLYRTSSGTSCTYLNRGTQVPVVAEDEPGHVHIAWANSIALTSCTSGTIVQLQFDLSGCADPAARFQLCSLVLLTAGNVSESLAVENLGTSVTLAGGGGHAPTCGFPPSPDDTKWWDGFDALGMNGQVSAMASWNSLLVAGGDFTLAGGVAANHVAAFDGTSWNAFGSGIAATGLTPQVNAVAVFGSDVVVAGQFTTAGGAAANNIARWDGSAWHPLGGGLFGIVRALATYNGSLYAGGYFIGAGSVATNGIARWDGSQWHAVGDGMGGPYPWVWALTVYNNALVAGGTFADASDVPGTTLIASWDGTTWQALDEGVNVCNAFQCIPWVWALAVDGTMLHAGGSFFDASGLAVRYLAGWDGSHWSDDGGGVGDGVYSLASYNGRLTVGGQFTEAGPIDAAFIAAWDDAQWLPLGSGVEFPASVYSQCVHQGSLYIGGNFTVVGHKPSLYIARWTEDQPTPAILPPARRTDPVGLTVSRVHPNPFASRTSFDVVLHADGVVRATVFDVRGQEVATILDDFLTEGRHTVSWRGWGRGGRVPAGVYTIVVEGGLVRAERTVLVLH